MNGVQLGQYIPLEFQTECTRISILKETPFSSEDIFARLSSVKMSAQMMAPRFFTLSLAV